MKFWDSLWNGITCPECGCQIEMCCCDVLSPQSEVVMRWHDDPIRGRFHYISEISGEVLRSVELVNGLYQIGYSDRRGWHKKEYISIEQAKFAVEEAVAKEMRRKDCERGYDD